jgi:hypothetical protein
LNEFNVIQLFSDVVDLHPEDHEEKPDPCNGRASMSGVASLRNAGDLLSLPRMQKLALNVRYTPGLAWAANRALLEDHGLYDAAIAGGGDSLMAYAMYGRSEPLADSFLLDATRQQHYLKWAVPFHKSVAGRIGHVPGMIYHLRHGAKENRAYFDRQVSLAGFDFDPDLDIRIGANGAWHWARPRPDLENFLQKYFVGRAEDD